MLVAAVAAAFMASAAQARLLPDGGVTPGEVVTELQAKGFKAELKNDPEGDPMATSFEGSGSSRPTIRLGAISIRSSTT